LQQAAQVFQLPADQIARAQQLLANNDASIAAASQAYEAAVAGRPDLVQQNLSFYNAATGTGTGLTDVQNRAAEAARIAEANRLAEEARTKTKTTTTASTVTMPKGYDQNFVNQLLREAAQQAGGTLSYADALAAAGRLGIPQRFIDGAMSSGFITEGRTPFANATQGFQSNFNNYSSIPIGAQYNAGVMGGSGGSPYSQIMGQMRPVGNPYAGVIANQPMGGYNPNIYDPNLLNNFVRQRASELAAAGLPVPLGFDGGGDGPGGAGDGAGSGAGDGGPGGAADGGSGPGDGPGTGAGWYMGGLIDKVSGANPAGPDDGQINVQVGEYVVKKSSVNKYGKGLLDQINDGKIPAKKMKSLLG
jgi:hypothetical protein